MKKKLIIGAVVPVVASLGLWLGLGGAAVAHASGARVAATVAESTSGPDTDNVQLGDQTGPDTAVASVQSSSSKASYTEQSGENQGEGSSSENSGGSDGPGGHQDPPGDVNHECTGNCQE